MKLNKLYPDYQIPKCSEEGCKINLDGIGKHVIFKGEKFTQTQENIKICDCFIFYGKDKLVVSLVELKGSSLNADEIIQKFENGWLYVSKILTKLNLTALITIQFVLLTKNHNNSSFFDKLKCYRIKAGGISHPIVDKTCNAHLKDLTKSLITIKL